MKLNRWSSFPRGWVRGQLKSFVGGASSGESMAALRTYLAIALCADFRSRQASLSWSELEELTGLSRPMVSKGLVRSQNARLVLINSSSYRHSYELVVPPVAGPDATVPFAQIPTARLKLALTKMPTRGSHALDALKLYVTIAAVRPRNIWSVPISHKSIVEWTGIQPNRVRAAVDVLINHRLVHVTMAESVELGHPHNLYQMLGFKRQEAEERHGVLAGVSKDAHE